MTPPAPPVHAPAVAVSAAAHGPLASVFGTWSRPPDLVAWAVAALGLVCLFVAVAPARAQHWFGIDPEEMDRGRRRRFVFFAGFAAAFLSLGYIAVYLRGGPRIIDATTYFLQGRALAHGKLAWKILDPTAEFRGRFLLFREPDRLAGIFPPGYPLLLAAGFLVGAPMVIGPLLAAALVALTYLLVRELLYDDPKLEPHASAIACLGVALSVVSAALRYHTADTMAHGAAAAGIASALLVALRARRMEKLGLFGLAGLAVGWVAATRMVSAVPIGVIVLALAARGERRWVRVAVTLAGMLPGLLLLALADRAATGSVWTFAQRAYYAVSDGPPGCFRYGFGAGIGCLDEHGEFVRAHLPHGFGIVAALGTTLRRLRLHLLDVANFEPLALLVVVPAFIRARSRATIGLVAVLGQIVVYAPFYFDGSYPGGGARLYADVLPVEHALVAIAVAQLWPHIPFARRALALLSLVCFGFAVHAVHEHIALAARDGGRPAYEPDAGRDAQITHGLVFFDTDAGFNLAYDPKAEPAHALLAARQHTDDHDRLLYERLGRPPAYAYRIGADGWNERGLLALRVRSGLATDRAERRLGGGRVAEQFVRVRRACSLAAPDARVRRSDRDDRAARPT
jgi:hypothetical protein